MNQGPDEQMNTPLEDALLSLPQEEPPTDLEANCLAALDEVTPQAAPRPRWEPWRQLMAAAAVLVMLVGVGNLLSPLGQSREKARQVHSPDFRAQMSAPDMAPAAPAPAPGGPAAGPSANEMKSALNSLGEERTTLNGWSGQAPPEVQRRLAAQSKEPAAGDTAAALPSGPAAPGGPSSGLPGKPTMVQGWFGQMPPKVKQRLAQDAAGANGPRGPAAYPRAEHEAAAPPATQPSYNGLVTVPAGKPWLDQSDTRRKVTERTMELETPDVEETYKQAVGLIEKSGGFVLQEGLTVRRRGNSSANLEARIPVSQFDGVVSQIRDLGRLVLMTGQSQDETAEYQAEGADIRSLGAREEDLADRYQREPNRQKKAKLASELQRVREQLREAKQSLKTLHRATSYARLSLKINESRGLKAIVKNAAEEALPLAFSLALIAVPLLILALLWKRRR